MSISVSYDPARDLTIFTAQGEFNYEDQIEAMREYYGGNPTPNLLLDMRSIEGERVSNEELRAIVRFAKEHGAKRPPGKTAIVSPHDVDFGLSRVVEVFGSMENLSWPIRPFRSMEKALEWIGG